MMHELPIAERLFEMHRIHCASQLKLATNLLELRMADEKVKRLDEELQKAKSDVERDEIDARFTEIDNQRDTLRDETKKQIERLTGVSIDLLQEANL